MNNDNNNNNNNNLLYENMGNTLVSPEELIKNDIENNHNQKVYMAPVLLNDNDDNIEDNNRLCDKYLKTVNNRTVIINKFIKGIVYKNKDEYGDFYWMINTGDYNNVLFIFDDNYEDYDTNIIRNDSSIIRQYNKFGKYKNIHSAGVIMGDLYNNGFGILDIANKELIDKSIENIRDLIIEYKYTEIYFQSDEYGFIKSNLYYLDNGITNYVSTQLFSLTHIFEKV